MKRTVDLLWRNNGEPLTVEQFYILSPYKLERMTVASLTSSVPPNCQSYLQWQLKTAMTGRLRDIAVEDCDLLVIGPLEPYLQGKQSLQVFLVYDGHVVGRRALGLWDDSSWREFRESQNLSMP